MVNFKLNLELLISNIHQSVSIWVTELIKFNEQFLKGIELFL